MKHIYTKPKEGSRNKTLEVYAHNDVIVGEMLINDDGYYVFFPEERAGYWPDYILSALAENMETLNASWHKEVTAYHKEEEIKHADE